jgi:hypothetical protein
MHLILYLFTRLLVYSFTRSLVHSVTQIKISHKKANQRLNICIFAWTICQNIYAWYDKCLELF